MILNYSKEFTEIKKKLEEAKNILLIAHSNPDADTIGSVFALQEYLVKNLDKKCEIICYDQPPQYIKDFLNEGKIQPPKNIVLSDYDLIEIGRAHV
jgi:nanoRNase/pAp phosphatase (c-di-AMP/oligoRNAs hydrolase)